KTYYFAYRNAEGVRKRIRIGRHGNITAPTARDLAEKQAASVVHGQDVQHEKKEVILQAERDKTKTLRSFFELRYEEWIKHHIKSPNSNLANIRRNFNFLMEKPMDEITVAEIEDFRLSRMRDGIQKVTINREMSDLNAMLNRAVEWDIIERHPLQKLRPLKTDDNARVRYLSDDEESNLRNALLDREEKIRKERESANLWRKERDYKLMPVITEDVYADHLRPMVLLAMNTGMRRGEIFKLSWSNVHFNRRQLTVLATTAKSGKTRHIPMNNEVMDVLKKWQRSSKGKLVFPGKEGKPMDNIKKSWDKLTEHAALDDFHFHDLRHHFASRLVMADVSLITVKDLLGHADLKMTLRYAHLSPAHNADAVAKLDRKLAA
ncbi:tyrosine-type recombinase/integrase, partial [Rickettsiales bacterium]|nr:tyrosine-type recombinase/integrase [Rickettsiales bacterium]